MSDNPSQDSNSTSKVLWMALTSSQAIFLFVAFQMQSQRTEVPEPNDIMSMVFFGLGAMNLLLATFVFPKIFKETPPMTLKIIQWAFIETNMIFAFVSSNMYGTSFSIIIGSFVLSMVAMLWNFPKEETKSI